MNKIKKEIDYGCIVQDDIKNIIDCYCRDLGHKYFQHTVFAPIENLSPRQRGKIYEKIVSYILDLKGYYCDVPDDTDYDLLVDKNKIEIKGALSTKGKASPEAIFNHIGMKKNWDYIIFLCLTGNDKIYMSCYTKEKLFDLNIMRHQQGGNRSDNDDFMINGKSSSLLFSQQETTFVYNL